MASNTTIILTLIIAIFIGVILAILYSLKFKTDVAENASFMRFQPFGLLVILFVDSTTTYSILEFDSVILDPSEAYKALKNHEFIAFSLQSFIACTAVCIAWHRSLVVDYQNKATRESNNISNYYLLEEYFEEKTNYLISNFENKYIKVLHSNKIFSVIFKSPTDGNFNPSSKYKEKIVVFNKLFKELQELLSLSAKDLKMNTQFEKHKFVDPEFCGVINNYLNYTKEVIPEHIDIGFPYSEIDNLISKIDSNTKDIFRMLGLELTENFLNKFPSDPAHNLIVIASITKLIGDVVNLSPIDVDSKIKFKSISNIVNNVTGFNLLLIIDLEN